MSMVDRLRHHYHRAPGTLRGMLLIGVSAFGFSIMHVMIRLLTGNLHPFEVAFFRNLFGVLALSPILARRGIAVLRTERLPLHAVRSILGLASMLFFFSALQRTGLPKVTAMWSQPSTSPSGRPDTQGPVMSSIVQPPPGSVTKREEKPARRLLS